MRFNPPPNWPPPPQNWSPPHDWAPDPAWPAPPPGWQLWIGDSAPGSSTVSAAAAPDHAGDPSVGDGSAGDAPAGDAPADHASGPVAKVPAMASDSGSYFGGDRAWSEDDADDDPAAGASEPGGHRTGMAPEALTAAHLGRRAEIRWDDPQRYRLGLLTAVSADDAGVTVYLGGRAEPAATFPRRPGPIGGRFDTGSDADAGGDDGTLAGAEDGGPRLYLWA